MVESGVVSDYKSSVNKAITDNLIPTNALDEVKGGLSSFATTASSGIMDGIYSVSKEQLSAAFFR